MRTLGAPPSGYFQGTVPTSVVDCKGVGGVAVQNGQGPAGCIPFFWTTAYLNAYQNLMQLLRARLDSSPKYASVSTIVDSACMAIYAEVLYRGQSLGYSNQTLYDAGLTHAADMACQQRAIEIHKSVFGATRRTSLAINDWDIPQGTPGANNQYRTKVFYDGGVTWATYELAEWARQKLTINGVDQLEVQNNGLHSTGASCPAGGGPTTSYWCYIAQFGGRHGFQTQSYVAQPLSPSGASLTLLQDLDNGLALSADFIELPSGMTSSDWSLMGCYDDHLVRHITSPCPH